MQNIRLSEVARVSTGFPFRAKVKAVAGGGVRVVQPKDLEEGALRTGDIVRTEIAQLKADYILHVGDTLLAARGRIAAADYFGKPSGVCVASGSLIVLRSKANEQLVPGYLTVFFNSDFGRACLSRLVSQATSTFVSLADIEAMHIPLPDVDRQVRLIAMARNVARYARLTERRTKLLNSLVSYNTHT